MSGAGGFGPRIEHAVPMISAHPAVVFAALLALSAGWLVAADSKTERGQKAAEWFAGMALLLALAMVWNSWAIQNSLSDMGRAFVESMQGGRYRN